MPIRDDAFVRIDRKALAEARLEFEMTLWREGQAALKANPPKDLKELQESFRILHGDGIEPADSLTPHEKLMDKWRVTITVILVVSLFGAILSVELLNTKNSASAAPYISLLSGLAGIALGWMFASAAQQSASGKGQGRASATTARASRRTRARPAPGNAAPAPGAAP